MGRTTSLASLAVICIVSAATRLFLIEETALLVDAFSSPSSTSNLFRPASSNTNNNSRGRSSVSSSALELLHSRSSLFQRSGDNTNNSITAAASSQEKKYENEQQRRSYNNNRQRHTTTTLHSSSSEDSSSLSGEATITATTATANGEDDVVTKLKAENRLLQERLKLLQAQNDELLKLTTTTGDENEVPMPQQRLILEDFEGEGNPFSAGVTSAATSAVVGTATTTTTLDEGEEDDELGLVSTGIDEDELCEYDDQTNKWNNNGIGECPVEPNVTFLDAMKSRAYWLVGLLALQSCSGFILSRNELLLQDHPVIVYFLTMLVGAGGNAGNQASVRVIRGLALGTLNPTTQMQFLSRELRMAFALSAILSLAGFFRAIVFQTPLPETMAVTLALSMIVFSSICLGAVLPLVLQKMGVDPAHSSTTIQVIMDILGVVLTVLVSTAVLDSVWGKMLIKSLGGMGI
jgi:cation transporter-like permease